MSTYTAKCMCEAISVEAKGESAAMGSVIASLSRLFGQSG